MNESRIVVCTECSEEHDTEAVKFLNIEEDIKAGSDIHAGDGEDSFYLRLKAELDKV